MTDGFISSFSVMAQMNFENFFLHVDLHTDMTDMTALNKSLLFLKVTFPGGIAITLISGSPTWP